MAAQTSVAAHGDETGTSPASVNRNVVANFLGSAWAALIGLAFVPVYIRLMGIESYGIVGVLASLQAIFAILDLGLSQTASREMARLSTDPRNACVMGDTARTIEAVYWCASFAVAFFVFALAGFVSQSWLSPEHLSRASLREAIWTIALVIGLRWPVALYTGAIIGLQRQVLLNALLAGFATVQGLGAVAVLWFVDATVQSFLLWQAVIALAQVCLLRAVLYNCIGSPQTPKFRKEILLRLWRFAAGMSSIALVSVLLTQTDKILLSKFLSLSDFGYYVFATNVAAGLYAITSAIFAAYQPRLTAVATQTDQSTLARTYHQACRSMALALIPAGAMLAFFSAEIVALWTGDPSIVANSSLLISLLAVGNVLHGLMHIPYALQLAFGWTRLALVSNVISVIFLVPAIYFSTVQWGAVGAAAIWVLLNICYVCISIHYMHHRLLPREKGRWYLQDVIKPVAAVSVVAGGARMVISGDLPSVWMVCALGAVSVAVFAAGFLSVRFSQQA
jgi:O-antigen/teichoic acid export membrane protein